MPKPAGRPYSRYTLQALALLGSLVRERRIEANLTAEALAERAGISRALLRRVERGDPGCSIGVVFEVAAILGIPLFDADPRDISRRQRHGQDRQVLLPRAVRSSVRKVKDDF